MTCARAAASSRVAKPFFGRPRDVVCELLPRRSDVPAPRRRSPWRVDHESTAATTSTAITNTASALTATSRAREERRLTRASWSRHRSDLVARTSRTKCYGWPGRGPLATRRASSLEISRAGRDVDRVLAQRVERHDVKGALVRRGEDHVRRRPVTMRAKPVGGGDAPPVAWNESWKVVLRHRRGEVVADSSLVCQEFGRDHGTDGVAPQVLRPRRTAPVAKKPVTGSVPQDSNTPPNTLRSTMYVVSPRITVAHRPNIPLYVSKKNA